MRVYKFTQAISEILTHFDNLEECDLVDEYKPNLIKYGVFGHGQYTYVIWDLFTQKEKDNMIYQNLRNILKEYERDDILEELLKK